MYLARAIPSGVVINLTPTHSTDTPKQMQPIKTLTRDGAKQPPPQLHSSRRCLTQAVRTHYNVIRHGQTRLYGYTPAQALCHAHPYGYHLAQAWILFSTGTVPRTPAWVHTTTVTQLQRARTDTLKHMKTKRTRSVPDIQARSHSAHATPKKKESHTQRCIPNSLTPAVPSSAHISLRTCRP